MMNKKKIINLIDSHKSFLISTHVNPDPDAVCSELAIAEALRALGKTVHIINESRLIDRLTFFPGAKRIKSLADVKRLSYEVAIILDCGDFERIGKVQDILDEQKPVINIDHHITNNKFGSVNHIDTQASSTAEMLFDLFQYARWPLNNRIATNIYCGIMTDTGSFRYENTTAKTHKIISELLQYNVKVSDLYSRIYETIPLDDIATFTKIVNRFETVCQGRVICVELYKKSIEKLSDDFDLRDAVFKLLRSVSGVEVIVIFSEFKRQVTRVNFRSTNYVDVAKIAAYFDGGGHKRASGCVVSKSVKDARSLVLKQIKKVL